ncbi:c-type cytochrome [Phenylobacterium deserti]|uniref:Cytochrome C n=1 Tax=Phenylobacterium deserti TaxID=1914756 RepID=A0A328AC17_9CAUL|nr:c-type cytochrome [Phenylobacterium deserti]RAK52190.1 cytochrome C [Phenylobacterium deserti]
MGLLLAPLLTACEDVRVQRPSIAGADAGHGRVVVERVGCGSCHVIPGVRWPAGRVGPSLDGFGQQALIAGRFPNQPEVLALWVRNAPALSPGTGMPPMPLTEQEARDVAAYLYTLDAR